MSFRDGLLGLSKTQFWEDVDTRFGRVRVKAPLVGRIREFIAVLGGEKKELPQTAAVLTALSCHDPETDKPIFEPGDVAELEKIPAAAFTRILEVIERVGSGLTLDPTTTATATS